MSGIPDHPWAEVSQIEADEMRIAAEGRGEETAAARLAVDVDEDLAAVVAASRAAGRPAWEDHLRALLEVGLSRR